MFFTGLICLYVWYFIGFFAQWVVASSRFHITPLEPINLFSVKTSMIYIWFYAPTWTGKGSIRITAITVNCHLLLLWSTAMRSTAFYILYYHLVRQMKTSKAKRHPYIHRLGKKKKKTLLVLVTGIDTIRLTLRYL